MSLKTRAAQSPGNHVPAAQYVPVYSRPGTGTDPALDETRTKSIHDAVKQWLESSPNSVIGQSLYRSPSPPSHEETPEQKGVSSRPGHTRGEPWFSQDSIEERFYDVGSGTLSPKQVSIEQSIAEPSGSSSSSPRPDRAVGFREETALPPIQDTGALPNDDGLSRANDGADHAESNPKGLDFAAQAFPTEDGELSAARGTEEGVNGNFNVVQRGGRKRSIEEFQDAQERRLYGLSIGSEDDLDSRGVSREFDNALALVVREIKHPKPIDTTLSCYTPPEGPREVLLKPPRGLENAFPSEQSLALVKSPFFRAASSTTEDNQNLAVATASSAATSSANERPESSAVVKSSPTFREGQTSPIKWEPFQQAASPQQEGFAIQSGATGNGTSVPEIVEAEFSDQENITDEGSKLSPLKKSPKSCYYSNLTKIEESHLEVAGSKKKTTAASTFSPPHLTIKAVLETHTSPPPGLISNGVVAVEGGGYEFRGKSPQIRRSQSAYNSAYNSGASTPNNNPIYKVSPLHQLVRKARSKNQNAVAPAVEEKQLSRDKSIKSYRSVETEGSVEREAKLEQLLEEKAQRLEELRVKADAWEYAKNMTILNKFKREESRIYAWEERKVAKAAVTLSRVESELEKSKAKAAEKAQYQVEQAHRKASEMKAQAESKRAERAAKAAVQAQVLRALGKSRLSCYCS